MLKQSSSRNLKVAGRGCKVKHVAQMCLMLAVSLWMLYLVRQCYIKKASFEETGVRVGDEKAGGDNVMVKLGRKGLLPGIVEEKDEEVKGAGDELEQVDDLMEESDEQELDDREQETQIEDVETEHFNMRNQTPIL